ncbi:MAG: DUF1819 family protein [Candidatus Thiodiazotropha lotti]|nr:DUF1819 family protein [Candidatus Thiodiazotropha lotti]
MEEQKYNMAFTTGGLMLHESVVVAALFHDLGDWDSVRAKVLSENLLQTRKVSSSKRWAREIVFRLQQLVPQELELLPSANVPDQTNLLWIAICRRFSFIGDFMAEVVRERYLALRNDLGYPDFDAFFEAKSGQHSELLEISPSTQAKLRQVLFRMLREAHLLTKDNQIMTPTLGRELASLLLADRAAEERYFPITDKDLRSLAK